MNISIPNPNTLPANVLAALESLVSSLQEWSEENHQDDGTHSNIVATGDLTVAGLATFTGQHRAMVRPHANITLATATPLTLNFNQPPELGFLDTGWNIGPLWFSTAPHILRAKVDGLYSINYSVRFAGSAVGKRFVEMIFPGAIDVLRNIQPGGADGNTLTGSIILPMTAGQFVYLSAEQTSGGNLDILGAVGSANTWFQMTKIG